MAACGGGPVEAGTAPLETGTQVSSQRYLADTAAAAGAVAAFSDALDGVAPRPRPAALRAAAPQLAEALARATTLSGRLAAERLEDRRLDGQRAAAAAALAVVVAAMDDVTTAARRGDAEAAAAASGRFTAAVGVLRSLPADS